MYKLYFLSGLPRTGTTLLSSILNQNPNVHTTSTSGLLDFLAGIDYVYGEVQQRYKEINDNQLKNIFKSIASSYYTHLNTPIIIDKWRGWIDNISQIKEIITPTPKIICTYRPVEEIITSFLFLLERDENNFIDKELQNKGISITNENRSRYLWKEGVVGESYEMFKNSIDKENILYISYDQLVNYTSETLKKIYAFLGEEEYDHKFDEISNHTNDNDDYWKIKNLHTIRSTLELQYKNPENYLTSKSIQYYKQFNSIFEHVK